MCPATPPGRLVAVQSGPSAFCQLGPPRAVNTVGTPHPRAWEGRGRSWGVGGSFTGVFSNPHSRCQIHPRALTPRGCHDPLPRHHDGPGWRERPRAAGTAAFSGRLGAGKTKQQAEFK